MTDAPASMPRLGAAIRHEWHLDPRWLTVNHGSFGATPKIVLAAQDEWRRRMEEQPSRFMRRVLPDALRHAAARLAQFVGASSEAGGKDLVFVENATVGANAVLRSLRFAPGDEILTMSHVYGAARNTMRFVAERTGAVIVEAEMPFPNPTEDAVVESLLQALTDKTKLVVLDHITSSSALVLPIERLVATCHDAGAPVLVDGAHGPGQVAFDLPAMGVDWYVGNCHKWLMSAKGCAFLWTRPDRQADLHPVTISHGYRQGYLAEFDWTGTRDPSAFLSIDAAIDFHYRLGGAALRLRNIALAAEAAQLLAQHFGTEIGTSGGLAGSMGLVRLPDAGPATMERAQALRGRMLDADTDVPIHPQGGALWLRLSAQAYNERADYEKLAEIVTAALHEQRTAG